MKKNYLGKLLAIAMVFAGFSLTSCDENDNAIIIDGKEWVKPDAIKTDDGAIITGNTASDISRILMKVAKDMNEQLAAGEDFVITIDAPALESEEGDNIINIPIQDYDTSTGAKIVVNFANPLTTDVPLLIQEKGASGPYYGITPMSIVDLNMPSGSSDIALEINMPKTSVTLNAEAGAVTIDELISTTSYCTLNIESGVTVNWLLLKIGYVVVKEGGKILGFLGNNNSSSLNVTKNGIKNNYVFKNEVPEGSIWSAPDDAFYYVQKGKILKSANGYASYVGINGYSEDPKNEVDIIISDGAKARFGSSYNTYCPSLNVIGEGDAQIMAEGYDDGGKIRTNSNTMSLVGIKNLINVTVDFTKCCIHNPETDQFEVYEVDESFDQYLILPQNAEDCAFISQNKYRPFYYEGTQFIGDKDIESTFKNCEFTNKAEEGNRYLQVIWPVQTDDRASFKLNFDSCELNQVRFYTQFDGDGEDYDDYKAYISLDNSKKDGKAITKDTELIYNVTNKSYYDSEKGETVYTTATFFNIDGKTYKPVLDEGKWILMPVE